MEAALGRRELLLPPLLLLPLAAAVLGPAAPLQLGQVPMGPGRGGASPYPSPCPSPCPSPWPSEGRAGPCRTAGGSGAAVSGLAAGWHGRAGGIAAAEGAGKAEGTGGRCAGYEGVFWLYCSAH